jgi:hypothetical protein
MQIVPIYHQHAKNRRPWILLHVVSGPWTSIVAALDKGQSNIAVCRRYTVKKIYRIPVFFFTKPFRNGKTPMLTRDFLVPSREGIFCLLRREKYSSLCRGNFFLSVECYISLFPLFPY